MKTIITLIAALALLVGCGSLEDERPTITFSSTHSNDGGSGSDGEGGADITLTDEDAMPEDGGDSFVDAGDDVTPTEDGGDVTQTEDGGDTEEDGGDAEDGGDTEEDADSGADGEVDADALAACWDGFYAHHVGESTTQYGCNSGNGFALDGKLVGLDHPPYTQTFNIHNTGIEVGSCMILNMQNHQYLDTISVWAAKTIACGTDCSGDGCNQNPTMLLVAESHGTYTVIDMVEVTSPTVTEYVFDVPSLWTDPTYMKEFRHLTICRLPGPNTPDIGVDFVEQTPYCPEANPANP